MFRAALALLAPKRLRTMPTAGFGVPAAAASPVDVASSEKAVPTVINATLRRW